MFEILGEHDGFVHSWLSGPNSSVRFQAVLTEEANVHGDLLVVR